MMVLIDIFARIPAHVGTRWTESADKVSNEATRHVLVETDVKVWWTEVKSTIKKKMREMWQKWEEERKFKWFYLFF